MFQFGYGLRVKSSADLLAVDGLANAFHALKLVDDGHKFSSVFTIYTNGNESLAEEISKQIEKPGTHMDIRKISQTNPGSVKREVLPEFKTGDQAFDGFLVHRPLTKMSKSLSNQLGLEYGATVEIKVSLPFNQTSVPLVYAAGDCATMMKIIPSALAMGAYAGCGIARDLPKHKTDHSSKDYLSGTIQDHFSIDALS